MSESSVDSPKPTRDGGRVPRAIGRYAIIRKLGQGGMGAVYEAEHTRLKKRIALKILPEDMAGSADARARFEREMMAVGQVSHHGIVQALDADEADGFLYLAMELVDGDDMSYLAKWYEREQGKLLPAGVACEVVRQAAIAMNHVHEAGLVHRDLKPSNVMLTRGGEVKVLDLGLALLDEKHSDSTRGLTSTGQVMGTVDFMAPEQAAETHTVDTRADVYSLGATLYRLLTGKSPYPKERYASMIQKLAALVTAEPRSVSTLRVDCDPQLVAIVEAAMARHVDDRIATALELAERLEPFSDADELKEFAASQPEFPPEASQPEFDSEHQPTLENVGETAISKLRGRFDNSELDETRVSGEADEAPDPNAPTFVSLHPTSASETTDFPLRESRVADGSRRRLIVTGVTLLAIGLVVAVAVNRDNDLPPPGVGPNGSTDGSALNAGLSERLEGIAFDGVDDHVHIPTLAGPKPETVSIELWCHEDRSLDQPANLITWSGNRWLSIWRRDQSFGVGLVDGELVHIMQTAPVYPAGRDHHVAGEWIGDSVRLVVDGAEAELSPVEASFGPTRDAGLFVGGAPRDVLGHERWYDGRVSQVHILEAPLPKEAFKPPQRFEEQSETIALLDFTKTQDTHVPEQSGGEHHGVHVREESASGASSTTGDPAESDSGAMLLFDGIDDMAVCRSLPRTFPAPLTIEFDGSVLLPPERPTEFLTFAGIKLGISSPKDRGVHYRSSAVEEGNVYARVIAKTPIDFGRVVKLAATWNGEMLLFYMDGELVGQTPVSNPKGGDFKIAVGYDGRNTTYLRCAMHSFRLSNVVRSADELALKSELTADESTIALYSAEHATETTLTDLSGNGHDARIDGATVMRGTTGEAGPTED